MRRALSLLPVLLIAASCSGKGNSGRTEPDPELIKQVPWIDGFAPAIDPVSKSAIVPKSPVYPPIGPNTPDPGSRVQFDTEEHRADACRAQQGIELSSWHHDFEPVGGGTIGVAQFFSAYDDHTEGAWHVPGDASWYDDVAGQRGGVTAPNALTALPPWGLAADKVDNAPNCEGPSAWALHVRGGRFNYFGGGAEHPLSLDCTTAGQAEACSMMPDPAGVLINASSYDGVSFWARRGPDGASGLMVVLQDKYTANALGSTVGHCQAVTQCRPTCGEGSTCQTLQLLQGDPENMRRCVPDAEGANPKAAIMEPALQQLLYPPCEESTCVAPFYNPNPDLDNTQCKPYNFTGLEENYWCFGDKPPAAPDQRCGDGFVSNISLSTDWTFYKLPFNSFAQVGFGKKAPPNDVPEKALYSIAFLFSVGYTDFFVDNLHFYRNL